MTEEIMKPGPKPKVSQEEFDVLQARVKALESMICKFASLAGQRNLCKEFDLSATYLTPWDPAEKDMRKYAS